MYRRRATLWILYLSHYIIIIIIIIIIITIIIIYLFIYLYIKCNKRIVSNLFSVYLFIMPGEWKPEGRGTCDINISLSKSQADPVLCKTGGVEK